MLATTWHLLLVAALVASYLSIARRIDERLGGTTATILWAISAVGAFDHVTVETAGGSVIEHSHAAPEVGVFAATFGLVMLAFTAAAIVGSLPSAEQTRFVNT